MRDASVTLPDGRTLAYTDLGLPGGRPVLYFHGAPTSRLDLVPFDDALAALGVRALSPDRPGYGGSSPQPGRTLLDWPADAATLADHLGIERFGVVGMSSGGPYALGCGARLADRLSGVAVGGGITDMTSAAVADVLTPSELESLETAATSDGALAWCTERFGADGSRFLDWMAGESGDSDLGAPDETYLADAAALEAVLATMAEAFAQGVGGYAGDVHVEAQPWSFDPATITVPVEIVHGADDRMAPLAHAHHNHALVPGSTLTVLPGVGHLSLVPHLAAMAARVAPT